MKNIAIFASGGGTNAENIISYFKGSNNVNIKLILTNNKGAFVTERAKKLSVPSVVFSNQELKETEIVDEILENNEVDIIILAGFLLLMPARLVEKYKGRILNIHPALLPSYGGKGMYGHHVHDAVVAAKEKESGITIHHVNEKFDEGAIIFQAKCILDENETPDSLAAKIHELEQEHFPKVIEEFVTN